MTFLNNNSWIINIWEQSDWSLIYSSWKIMSPEEREKIIQSSLSTPARKKESEIKNIITDSVSSIIIWETWSWKTTEIAQMIHEVFPNDLVITNIPLVWATIWTWTYVSDIMYAKTWNPYYSLWNWWVSYRTWKWSSEKNRTQIGFHTYWLDYLNLTLWNLERTINSSNKNIHIVLDEIHEKWEDFVFYLTKIIKLSHKYPKRIKLYWASATMSENYIDILSNKFKKISNDVPVLKIDWRTFPIDAREDIWWDSVNEAIKYYNSWKSVLVFQPGKWEINKTIEELKKELWEKAEIYPFHSEVSSSELKNILSSNDNKKIFVATNAARTWVTLDINSVVDSWVQKMQYFNESWIPVLVSEAITEDAYHQNKWRAWRKENWYATYNWYKAISELEKEAPSSVEIKVDEKKILLEIMDGENILRNENKWVKNYLFNPNKNMMKLSYDWMKDSWLITKDEKLTIYGYESLKLPMNVFNSRVILEWIENGIWFEMAKITSIIENKWFIKKWFKIHDLPSSIYDKNSYSDLDYYTKIFDLFCKKELTQDDENLLLKLWFTNINLNYFKSLDWNKKFYQVIWVNDFERIWVKYKNLERTDETFEKVLKYFSNSNFYKKFKDKDYDLSEKNNLISRSLLSWYLHKIYKLEWKDKLECFYWNHDIIFQKSDLSFLNTQWWTTYIWEPFIIWWNSSKDDLAILSFLTEIDEADIYYYESKKYTEYKINNDEKNISKFSIDDEWDTFEIWNKFTNRNQKQLDLSQNWLPYFLVEKNKYVWNYIKSLWDNYDKDNFVKALQKITLKFSWRIDPDNKDNTIELFQEDSEVLGALINSKDVLVQKVLSWEKNIDFTIKEKNKEKSDFFETIKTKDDYNKVLKESLDFIEKYKIDIEKIALENLDEIISNLEQSSTWYNELFILLDSIKSWNIDKLDIKRQFDLFNKKSSKILRLSKRNSWVESFLNWIKWLSEWEDINLNDLNFWTITDLELLYTSPIIKELNLIWDINSIKKIYLNLRKQFNKINVSDKINSKNNVALQKLLYSNKNTYKSGLLRIEKINSKLFNLINELYSENVNLRNDKNIDSAEKNILIKENNIQISNIKNYISKLWVFKNLVSDLREKIESFKFKNLNIVYNDKIYSKKFLYSTILDLVFNWDSVIFKEKTEDKLEKRIKTNFKWKVSWLDEIIHCLKNKKMWKDILDKNDLLKEKVSEIEDVYKKYSLEKQVEIDLLKSDNLKELNIIVDSLENILLKFYSKDFIDLNKNKLINFWKSFYNIDLKNFDKELKKFILKFSSWLTEKLWEWFNDINKYKNNIDYIKSFNFVENINSEKNDDLKILLSYKNKISKLNKNILNLVIENKNIIDIDNWYDYNEILSQLKLFYSDVDSFLDSKFTKLNSDYNIDYFIWFFENLKSVFKFWIKDYKLTEEEYFVNKDKFLSYINYYLEILDNIKDLKINNNIDLNSTNLSKNNYEYSISEIKKSTRIIYDIYIKYKK